MAASTSSDARPLVMHVVYRFGIGGLENGIVNLINRLPSHEFRHAIVALTDCDPGFSRRLSRDDVDLFSLRKPPGHGWQVFRPIWRVFRECRPAIVHTRNLAALEMQIAAWAARVPIRLHGEHGRDMRDPNGESRRYRLVRRALSPFVTHYVAVSIDLADYLVETVGIARERVSRICNGVDETKFSPILRDRSSPGPFVVGTIGRLDEVKGQRTLIAAVARLLAQEPQRRTLLRVKLVGEGPMRSDLVHEIAQRGLEDVVELVGQRDDVAHLLRTFDVFALPSLAEGSSNTVLEAMASGVPVVATAVGGNAELVTHGVSGWLVAPDDATALASAIGMYLNDAALRRMHGLRGREIVETEFSLTDMVERYRALYRTALQRLRPLPHLATHG